MRAAAHLRRLSGGYGANCPNLKGFKVVLHCRNMALFAAMSTPDATARAPSPLTAAAGEPPRPTTESPPPEPRPREIGGRPGPEPTRFGDWERGGRCIDF